MTDPAEIPDAPDLDSDEARAILINYIKNAKTRKNGTAMLNCIRSLNFRFENATLAIGLPHPLFTDYYKKSLQATIESLCKKCFGEHLAISCHPYPDNIPNNARNDYNIRIMPERAPISPFADFIISEKNRLAVEAAKSVPDQDAPPLLIISGPYGSGKSHLLSAIHKAILSGSRANACIKCPAAEFWPAQKPEAFWHGPRALLLDDAQDISADIKIQALLARHLDYARNSPYWARIIITINQPDLSIVGNRLASKLEAGLKVELCKADLPMRIRFAEAKCRELGLPRQHGNILARHSPNISALLGLLQKLAFYGKIIGRFPPAEQIEKMTLPSDKLPDWQLVIHDVATRLQVKPADLPGSSRIKKINLARQIAMYLCRTRLGLSYPEIGRLFGGRDHSTVMHGINKIQELRHTDNFLHNLLTELEQPEDIFRTFTR